MLHVRVDEALKVQAVETLANVGLTVSDAVRILLTLIAKEGGLPAGLTAVPAAHDVWFGGKVHEALYDKRLPVEQAPQHIHEMILAELQRQNVPHNVLTSERARTGTCSSRSAAPVSYASGPQPKREPHSNVCFPPLVTESRQAANHP